MQKGDDFFDQLCIDYYQKVLGYLYAALNDESAARDCTQEVFLTALQKISILRQHPNSGGFLFQTAKNLAKKSRREGFVRLLHEQAIEEKGQFMADVTATIEYALDREIDEQNYIETVLETLSEKKRLLYTLHYISHKSMAEIAEILEIEETALRMRYVRLRREIREVAKELAKKHFIF